MNQSPILTASHRALIRAQQAYAIATRSACPARIAAAREALCAARYELALVQRFGAPRAIASNA
jgi:hypothetical protein